MTHAYKELTRLYRCSDYPRRVRAESPGHAAGIWAVCPWWLALPITLVGLLCEVD